jgi:MFS family permease
MMVATIACQSVGMLLAAMLALLLLRDMHSTETWRLLLVTEGIIALIFFLLRLSEPDSPHWLMTRGRFAEAAKAFIRIAPEQRETVLQTMGNDGNQRVANSVAPPKPGILILFSRAYRARTVLVALPWFLMDIATYGVGLFTPIILGAIEGSAKKVGVIAHEFADVKGSTAIDLFLLLGFLLGMWVVPRFGRIRMQAIGFAGMAFGMLLLMIAVRLSTNSPAEAGRLPLVFAGFILFNLLMNAGPNSTTFTLAPILFPIELRGTASGFAAGVAKLGATFGVFVLPVVKGKFGVPAVLGMMGAVSVLGLVVTLMFGHEDKEG